MQSAEQRTAFSIRGRVTRGLSRVELIVEIVVIVIAVTIALVSLDRGRPHSTAMRLKDATMITQIHKTWLVYAGQLDGLLPTPGLVDRLPFNGVEEPGRGPEDISKNTTANLFALCISQNYFHPELCVGPTEPSPRVTVHTSYNWNFATGAAWDPTFVADLVNGSNVSYAHMPLVGTPKRNNWRDTSNAGLAILGNRGPLNGVHDPESYTLKIHEPHNQWSGNICFADNHVEFFTGLPTAKAADGKPFSTQGLFRMGQGDDHDGFLTFTKEMTENGPVIQHD